jgi:BirA family biotin operon repressor/biotin-[acetyl-CoA-carboxylase] ligase
MSQAKFKVFSYDEIKSTNLQASALLSEKKHLNSFVVQTEFQSMGRGQGSGRWHSEEGLNLLCSIVIKPESLKAEDQFYLSKIAALSLYDLISPGMEETYIKWPNDILVGNGKIAGILVENTIQKNLIKNSIIGIGLNVNQVKFPQFDPEATSMSILTGDDFEIDEVLDLLLDNFSFWYESITEFDADYIDHAYLAALYRINKKAKYKADGVEFEGTIAGVEPDGRLKIQTKNGEFKEIEFI